MQFTVVRGPEGLVVQADRVVLGSAVTNLVQNAFKFTRPAGHVQLRALGAGGRVRIEIEDECGGLKAGEAGAMFSPFHQRRNDRSGLGLGLTIVRRGVEANKGIVSVRDLPGLGCTFAIDLPAAAD